MGPTSLDTVLAFIMANIGHAGPGKLMLDPFVGTASILVMNVDLFECFHLIATLVSHSYRISHLSVVDTSDALRSAVHRLRHRHPGAQGQHARWKETSD